MPVCESRPSKVLERFGTNGLGDAPGRFTTSEQRRNLLLTVVWVVESIPNVSKAPPAVDSAESWCRRCVGHLVGSTPEPRRPSRLPPSRHSRSSFATTAAPTSLAHAPEHPLDVSGVLSLLSFPLASISQPSSPPPTRRHPRATTTFNSSARRRTGVAKLLGGVQGTHPGCSGQIG